MKALSLNRQNMMKVLPIIAGVLFVICLPVLFITSNIRYAANTPGVYEYSFNKYDVEEITGISRPELDRAAREMIHYFNSNDKFVDIKITDADEQYDLFDSREITHLKDVKHLIQVDYWLQIGTLVYVLAFITGTMIISKGRRWRWLLTWLFIGCVFTIFLMLVMGLAALLGFDQLFQDFHQIFFSNDFYILYEWETMGQMFPQQFFNDITIYITLAAVAEGVLFGGISGGVLLKTRAKKTNITNDK